MAVNDPIGDLITRIRNAQMRRKEKTSTPGSRLRANVLEVLHTRHNGGLQISQVQLELHIETRGPEHADAVLARLRADGFEPRVDF